MGKGKEQVDKMDKGRNRCVWRVMSGSSLVLWGMSVVLW